MEFLAPSFLWALFALALPVLIHLFHFRRYKTVYFPNVKFLKEVQEERNQVRHLKRWLLLAARLLAILFLVLAFARPVLRGGDNTGEGRKAVSVFFDNSASMELQQQGVPLLERGRDRARELVESYGPENEFQVLTQDMTAAEQRWTTREEALNYIDQVKPSGNSLPLQQIFDKQDYLFSRAESKRYRRLIVSDFQESMLEGAAITADSVRRDYFVRMASDDVRNLFVDSVWMPAPVRRSGGSNAVLYRLVNSSPLDAAGIRVTLSINDRVQSVRELYLAAGERRTDTLYMNIAGTGWQTGEIALEDYPVTSDDRFFFSFEVPEKYGVLEIYQDGSPDVVRRIFSDDDLVRLERSRSDRLNYSTFSEYRLIVLHELTTVSSGLITSLEKYMDGGGNILLIPSEKADPAVYDALLTQLRGVRFGAVSSGNFRLQRPDLSNVLLRHIVDRFPENVRLPEVRRYFPLQVGVRTRIQPVFTLNNGQALLAQLPGEAGHLFVQTVPASTEYSDLTTSWLYAPVVYNLALYHNLRQPLYLTAGVDRWVALGRLNDRGDDVVRLVGHEMELIPEQRIADNRLLINPGRSGNIPPGQYRADWNGELFGMVSINTDRRESVMRFAGADELRERFPDVSEIAEGATASAGDIFSDRGKVLWRWCLALALLFLLMEIAILKWLPD